MRCQPVKRMQVWDSCSDSMITFNNDDLNDNLAYIVENDVILEAVKRSLPNSQNLNIKYNTSAKSYIIPGITPGHDSLDQNSWVTVQLNDGSEIKTKLLIGADGMNSTVRKACEFHTLRSDYGQSGLVATLKLTGDTENNVAWQRFLPTGPIAMLPLSNTDSCLIWTTTTENAKHLKQLSEDSFIDAVNDAFWHDRDMNSLAISAGGILNGVLNNILPGGASHSRQLPPTVVGVAVNSRAAFPLGLLHSSSYAGHRVALIGDAAHRIHPLAGQGVNLGFGDVACLTDLLVEAVKNGTDLGSLALMAEYETQRQRSVLPVVGVIDGLQRLYSNSFTPIVMLRSLGLQTVNSLHFLKKIVIKQAST
ncbi:ubiquinone biosynthesis monooxygenase COQ6, mitochondrial-like isoform X2 [Mytilus trossulus]